MDLPEKVKKRIGGHIFDLRDTWKNVSIVQKDSGETVRQFSFQRPVVDSQGMEKSISVADVLLTDESSPRLMAPEKPSVFLAGNMAFLPGLFNPVVGKMQKQKELPASARHPVTPEN